jgi:hypothetical protein
MSNPEVAPHGAVSVLPTSMTVVPNGGRSRVPLLLIGLTAVVAAYLAMLALKPGGSELTVKASDVLTTAAAIAASLSCALTGRRHAGALRAFWWLLAAACTSWAVGEATWTFYEVVLRVAVPYPSWADVGYLAGTPLAVAAFTCHPAAHSRGRQGRLLPLLDAIAAATSLLLVSWILVLHPLWHTSGGKTLGDLVALAYPFGDVIILVLLVVVVRNLRAGSRPATLLLLAGLLSMALTDSAYTYLVQIDSYHSGDLLDTGWVLAYLAIAAAGRVYESPLDTREAEPGPARLTEVLAPYAPIIIALTTIGVSLSHGRHLDRVEWLLATGLTGLVLTRQLLVLIHFHPARRSRTPTSEQGSESGARRRPSGGIAPSPTAFLPPIHQEAPGTSDTRLELQALTLQMLTAARPAPRERVQRITGRLLVTLTSSAGILALWDLSLLIRAAGGKT